MALFPGFKRRRIRTSGATINLVTKGDGAPLLLLHGYPETHAMWHKIAPPLAQDYTVVCADLRGYGDSSKPKGLPDHSNYSKRALARDMAQVMAALGQDDQIRFVARPVHHHVTVAVAGEGVQVTEGGMRGGGVEFHC